MLKGQSLLDVRKEYDIELVKSDLESYEDLKKWSPSSQDALHYEKAAELVSTARDKQRGKKIGNNTYVREVSDGYAVKLHRTDVVTFHPDKTMTLNTGGWDTPTTKSRINDHMPSGTSVYNHKGSWHVQTNDGHMHKFEDGMRIDQNGHRMDKEPVGLHHPVKDAAVKQAKRQAKLDAAAKLKADQPELPLKGGSSPTVQKSEKLFPGMSIRDCFKR